MLNLKYPLIKNIINQYKNVIKQTKNMIYIELVYNFLQNGIKNIYNIRIKHDVLFLKGDNMLKVKKIEEKVELKDMEINADPCKYHWTQYHTAGRYDCLRDCKYKGVVSPYGSDRY